MASTLSQSSKKVIDEFKLVDGNGHAICITTALLHQMYGDLCKRD